MLIASPCCSGPDPPPPRCHCALQLVPGVPFFASKILLGTQGVAKVMPIGEMSAFEKESFAAMVPQLKEEIAKGVAFVKA